MLKLSIIAALALAYSAATQAQATDQAATISHLFIAQCPQVTSSLLSRKDFGPTLAARPPNIQKVCACTGAAFQADDGVQLLLGGEPDAVAKQSASEHLKSYLFTRLLTSMMSCLLPELEAALTQARQR